MRRSKIRLNKGGKRHTYHVKRRLNVEIKPTSNFILLSTIKVDACAVFSLKNARYSFVDTDDRHSYLWMFNVDVVVIATNVLPSTLIFDDGFEDPDEKKSCFIFAWVIHIDKCLCVKI